MTTFDKLLDNLRKDNAIINSVLRYNLSKLTSLGLQISYNSSQKKERFIGDINNPIYPDILIWKPDPLKPGKGKTALAELVETSQSIGIDTINKLKKLTLLEIPCNLIYPEEDSNKVTNLLNANPGLIPLNRISYTMTKDGDKFIYHYSKDNG